MSLHVQVSELGPESGEVGAAGDCRGVKLRLRVQWR